MSYSARGPAPNPRVNVGKAALFNTRLGMGAPNLVPDSR